MAIFTTTFDPSVRTLNANDIYGGSIYHPRGAYSTGTDRFTLESLNGNISYENFVPFRKSVDGQRSGFEASAFRAGMFARGYYYGFDFPDRFHASQYVRSDADRSSIARASQRLYHTHPSLAVRFFCPWPAVCYVGVQGFFSGDLTRFVNPPFGNGFNGEQWDFRFMVNGVEQEELNFVMPSTRSAVLSGAATITGNEYRYRWVNRSTTIRVDKGFTSISVDNWPRIEKSYNDEENLTDPKIQNRSGGIWVLAIRAPSSTGGDIGSFALPDPGSAPKGGSPHQPNVDNIVADRNFDTSYMTQEGLEKYNESNNRNPSLNDNPAINVILPEDNQ